MANQQQPDDNAATQAPLSPKGAARRRFTRAGAATGVLLTLHSQSALAGGGTPAVCTTASGFMSGALRSTHTTQPVSCSGLSPGYWKNVANRNSLAGGANSGWPRPVLPTDHFSKYFPSTLEFYGSASMLDVLSPPNSGYDISGLGRHLVAAYLNVLSGKSSFQTTAALQKMWSEWRDFGFYTPIAGVKWTAYDIVNYLKQTMT